MKAFAPSLDTVGLFAAGIDDIGFLFSTPQGNAPRLQPTANLDERDVRAIAGVEFGAISLAEHPIP